MHLPEPITTSMASLEISKAWKDEICSQSLQLGPRLKVYLYILAVISSKPSKIAVQFLEGE